jgi:glycosyltransferase involved in cell wall biosynthesis
VPTWIILTGEYPPQPGGVSDYTRSLARGLAAHGERVQVWAPPTSEPEWNDAGVEVRRLPGHFDRRSLGVLSRLVERLPDQTRILIQYVPQSFGCRAMNVPFALWVWRQGRRHAIWTMFHEVSVYYGWWLRWQEYVLAFVTRHMARLVARGSSRIFISIPGWEPLLRSLTTVRAPVTWLPVPTNLPEESRPEEAARIRAKLLGSGRTLLIGHFGTYGASTTNLTEPILLQMAGRFPRAKVVLLGRGSREFCERLRREHSSLNETVCATGPLPASEVADHLASCDLLLQPYPDGISGRRTSAMAGLALGVPTVTNVGGLTEDLWRQADCVALAPEPSPEAVLDCLQRVADDPAERARLGRRGREIYQEHFSLEKTVNTLVTLAERGQAF